jgi:hypothetical protein
LKSNEGLHYLTSSLSLNDEGTKKKLIDCIDQYLEEYKQKNIFKADLIHKEPKVKALNRLKNLLFENSGDKKIFGKTLKEPLSKHKEIYLINKKITQIGSVYSDINSEFGIKQSTYRDTQIHKGNDNLSFRNQIT